MKSILSYKQSRVSRQKMRIVPSLNIKIGKNNQFASYIMTYIIKVKESVLISGNITEFEF